MAEFILRPALEQDREQIISIWHGSFGDSPGLISALLNCGLMDTAVGAELDGALRSVMFAFDGLELGGRKYSYLYALCTEDAYRSRGLGRAVTAGAADAALKRGADGVFLRPGDEGLEGWYASMGAEPVARSAVKKTVLPPVNAKICTEISALEYLHLRSGSGWQLPASLLLAQGCIQSSCGGAFLRCESGIVCAEQSGDGLLIRECISSSPETALASAAAHFSVNELLLLRTGENGLPLMRMPGGKTASKCAAFPLMPFTLD